MREVFFSVIIPTHNREGHIKKSINSVQDQTFKDWELLIIDDGSEDNTYQIIKEIEDSRVKYYYQKNQGVSSARNCGMEKATGQYICFLDDDDEYLNNHLSIFYDEIVQRNYPITSFCTHICFSKNNQLFKDEIRDYSNSKSFNILPFIQAVCIHKNIAKEHKFKEDLAFREDHEFLDRVREEFGINVLDKYSVKVIKHVSNTTAPHNRYVIDKGIEKTTLYYMRSRGKISFESLNTLYGCYSNLILLNYRKKKYADMTRYIVKFLLLQSMTFYRKEMRRKNLAIIKKILFKNKK